MGEPQGHRGRDRISPGKWEPASYGYQRFLCSGAGHNTGTGLNDKPIRTNKDKVNTEIHLRFRIPALYWSTQPQLVCGSERNC